MYFHSVEKIVFGFMLFRNVLLDPKSLSQFGANVITILQSFTTVPTF
jgi:hypothetical protein